jgi:acetolactate synthase-1/2/3 large subunit
MQQSFRIVGRLCLSIVEFIGIVKIDVYHCRSESGAAFCAMEHSLHMDKIAVVFATSGPRLSNAFTALRSARADGAKIVVLSAITTEVECGAKKRQETTSGIVHLSTGDSLQSSFSQSIIMRHHADLENLWHLLQDLQSSYSGCLFVFTAPEV